MILRGGDLCFQWRSWGSLARSGVVVVGKLCVCIGGRREHERTRPTLPTSIYPLCILKAKPSRGISACLAG